MSPDRYPTTESHNPSQKNTFYDWKGNRGVEPLPGRGEADRALATLQNEREEKFITAMRGGVESHDTSKVRAKMKEILRLMYHGVDRYASDNDLRENTLRFIEQIQQKLSRGTFDINAEMEPLHQKLAQVKGQNERARILDQLILLKHLSQHLVVELQVQ